MVTHLPLHVLSSDDDHGEESCVFDQVHNLEDVQIQIVRRFVIHESDDAGEEHEQENELFQNENE